MPKKFHLSNILLIMALIGALIAGYTQRQQVIAARKEAERLRRQVAETKIAVVDEQADNLLLRLRTKQLYNSGSGGNWNRTLRLAIDLSRESNPIDEEIIQRQLPALVSEGSEWLIRHRTGNLDGPLTNTENEEWRQLKQQWQDQVKARWQN